MRRGFSLLEIIVSTTILLLLLGTGLMFSFPYLRRQQLNAAATATVSELRQAQAEAYAQKNDAAHGIKAFTDRVVRFEGASYAARATSKDRTTQFPTTMTVSGISEFVFPASSYTPSASGTLTITQDYDSVDIAISSYGVFTVTQRTSPH